MMAEFSIKFTLPDNQKTPAQLRVVTGVFIPGSLLFLDVKNQAVINQLIAHFFNDFLLPLLNFFVVKLEHLARVYTYDVVMMLTIIQLKHGVTTIKVMPDNQSGILKLGQNPIHSRQADIVSRFHQCFIDILGTRSEERRVGKECRSRWVRDPLKKIVQYAYEAFIDNVHQ